MSYNDEHDNLEIELKAIKKITSKKKIPNISSYKITPLYNKESGGFPIFVFYRIYNSIINHADSNQSKEVGGFLLGNYYCDDENKFLEVSAFIEARFAKEGMASLTFTHRTWMQVNDQKNKEHPDKRIVGWYHTHPGYGIFLSKHDLFIHKNFFNNEEQIAFVRDPVRKEEGFFFWDRGEIIKSQSVFLLDTVEDVNHDLMVNHIQNESSIKSEN